LLLVFAGYFFLKHGRSVRAPATQRIKGKRTVCDVLRDIGPSAESRLTPAFEEANAPYPPSRVALIALKDERQLELWATDNENSTWMRVHSYTITAASGKPGPKRHEGDMQVPEGHYRIIGLNPNSSYHLSMKLDYPSAFDQQKAREENRSDLGGDIFIHGKAVSSGCIAVGDEAIEELFTLVARIGKANVKVLIAPNDLRKGPPATESTVPWVLDLYADLAKEMREFDAPR